MSKNYSFLNAIAAVAIALCVSLGFQSCGNIDNPLEEIVNTVSEKTGLTPAQVSALIEEAMSTAEVQEAIANQTPITVEISGGNTSSGNKTITIPMEDPVGGKKLTVELKFTDTYGTSETNPLVLKASEGAGDFPGESNNNLVVTMPPSEGLAITIELPETTVTLKTDGTGAVVYKDVIAKTAKSTIIIDKGVTIKEHELVGGNIVVNDGGTIETIALTVKDNFGFVSLGSWWSKMGFMETGLMEYYITNEDGSPYIPKNLRIKKGNGNYISVETRCRADEYVERVTVDEGITIAYGGGDEMGQYKNIEGKGNTRLHTRAGLNENEYFTEFSQNTELVRNFTIANELHDVDELYRDIANLVIVFNGSDTGSRTFTFENCDFENNKTQFVLSVRKYKAVMYYLALEEGVDPSDPNAWQHVHKKTNLQELLDLGIPNVEVEGGESGGYWKDEQLEDDGASLAGQNLTFTLIFKNCTIGGVPITKDNVKFPIWGLWTPRGVNEDGNNDITYQVVIDGKTYNTVSWYGENDERNGTITLKEANK